MVRTKKFIEQLRLLRTHPPASGSEPRASKQEGITLAELMMALPLATIILVILFSALFTQYTSVLAESARSNLRSAGQTLLINMQDELLFTIAFGENLDVNLTDAYEPTGPPQGAAAGGWTYDTAPQTLIINEIALDSTRRDDDRRIIRQQLSDCETSGVTANPVAINNVIYFIEDVPGAKYDNLRKRTVTPTYSTCSIDSSTDGPCTPETTTCKGLAKGTSCPEAEIGNNNCVEKDLLLSENIIDIDIQYFAEDNVSTPFPSAADKIEVVLTMGETVYGKEVVAEVKHTIRKIN